MMAADVNPNIFREYDVRGLVETDLVNATVETIGKAFGTHMLHQDAKKLVVGRDVRLSSKRLRDALVKGLLSTGAEVMDLGEVPTPLLYFAVVHYPADGGIMVTGSHNPIEYNGFKMCKAAVAPIYGEEIQELRSIIEKGDYLTGKGKLEERAIVSDYLAMLKSKIRLDRKLKMVIDAGNGTAGVIAVPFFRDLGCEVVALHCEPDGRFPHHLPDPTVPKYVEDLRKKVTQVKADVGIGYDGDGDRLGVIDDQGRIVFADRVLALLSRDVLSKHPGGKIVFDVKCSQALPEEIQKYGGLPLMWKTGHSLLKAKLKEEKAPLAGEMSGHIFYADDFFGYDDAIYVSARFVQFVARTGKKVSELADELPAFEATPEIRIECSDEEKFNVVADLVEYFKEKYQTIDVDGARVLFGDGWGLVRASNTQPVLVLRFEARTRDRLRQIMDIFKAKLREYPAVKFTDEDFAV